MDRSQSAKPHLWKHANGTYYAVWRERGGPQRKSLGTRQLVQAERALARLIAKSRPGRVDIELTVWKAVDKWLDEKHKEARRC